MKKYVKVTATFDCDGDLIPEYIVWDDGRRYRIDKISDVRYAASLKAGGAGIRYTPAISSAKNDICFWRKTGGLSMPNNKRRIICIRSKQREFYLPQTA